MDAENETNEESKPSIRRFTCRIDRGAGGHRRTLQLGTACCYDGTRDGTNCIMPEQSATNWNFVPYNRIRPWEIAKESTDTLDHIRRTRMGASDDRKRDSGGDHRGTGRLGSTPISNAPDQNPPLSDGKRGFGRWSAHQ